MYSRRGFICGTSALSLTACITANVPENKTADTLAKQVTIESFDSSCANIIDLSETGEMLSSGHGWLEGPAWDSKRQALYFTDVPKNVAYRWEAENGTIVFLKPSGIAAEEAKGFREPGANGLLMGQDGRLIICNHGKRAVESMDIDTLERKTLIGSYQSQQFNSPNDVIQASDGTLYFTDPPYGFEGLNNSPLKQLKMNGVYKLSPDGIISVIFEDMTFPNGIALSPDESWLYVTQSDPDAPIIRRLNLRNANARPELWFNASQHMNDGAGLPDGLAIAEDGTVFATGPGGVFIINPEGQAIGRINTGRATANCTFGEDAYTLFITAQDRLLRVRTKIKGRIAV